MTHKDPEVSIIVRAKNEERWIGRCLRAIQGQAFRDFEVIVVDNHSTDQTLTIASKYPVKIVQIEKFRPGRAINSGVRAARGRLLVCLSAHCIPRDANWLGSLRKNMDIVGVAGVYGRQLPMPFSSDLDKRDLMLTFGLDHRIQIKDPFFHNANSMFRRDVWDRLPFDEEATNIEDQIWGRAVIKEGLRIAYEPEAAVFHHHGIHQQGNEERAKNVVRILESLDGIYGIDAASNRLDILAIAPVLGPELTLSGQNLLKRCLNQLKAASRLSRIAVIAEDPKALKTARSTGADVVARPPDLSRPEVGVEEVLRYALRVCENLRTFDAVVYANYLFPFRPAGFFDLLTAEFDLSGADTVVPTLPDYAPYWNESEDGLIRVDAGLVSRSTKRPVHKGLVGLGTITSADCLRRGSLLGEQVGLLPIDDPRYALKATETLERSLIEKLLLEDTIWHPRSNS
jgi:hypothetical protein